ncbi:Transcription initiation factor IIF subunit alpha like [Quillaja saponaria]|uniref:Transcription initiation factor IIF subunit alpha n=1 Tax=Quillaja saponaria TaxID=32244 RepID=A0AAD7L176_QUISA|nr:Transcription initiation factor IIF subunit alpha like [Quillaja saponaria]
MSIDLLLKPSCSGCGSSTDLYGSNCKHMTLCLTCGKTMAENKGKCYECGATVTRLIREYNVRASPSTDKNYFIGRFVTGLPDFSKKKSAENKWSLHKEGPQGRQLTEALREKYKNRPWLLEDETGQSQYQGQLEGAQSATYYLLMMERKEFVAIPAGSWYNFNKVAQYRQLTLEEAEEKMVNRKKTAEGYQRWIMKAANNGSAAFGQVEPPDDKEAVKGGGKGRKKTGNDDEGNVSDRGEEDEEQEAARKNRLGLNKRAGDDDDEGARGGDHDMDDDDIEKGDDWEHEEIFTDDDEAVGNDPEEREDLAPEVPAPPEIKQDEDDENEDNEEEGGLSKSGKELKKLLGRTGGLNDSDADDDDDDEEMDDETFSSVLAPKQKDAPKEEPADNSPLKPAPSGPSRGTPPTSKSAKGKRKLNGEEAKASNGAPPKKVKTENELKSVKEESVPIPKSTTPSKGTPPPSSSKSGASSTASGPVTEEEIRAVLMQKTPVTTQDLVAKFKARLRSPEDKTAFAEILRRISKIQKTNGSNFVVLRDR